MRYRSLSSLMLPVTFTLSIPSQRSEVLLHSQPRRATWIPRRANCLKRRSRQTVAAVIAISSVGLLLNFRVGA